MTEPRYTTLERLIRLETLMTHSDSEILKNGAAAQQGIKDLTVMLTEMDKKWDERFNELAEKQLQDAQDLQTLKSKGGAVLATLGAVFTLTATVFSDFFSAIKHTIFG